MPETLRQDPSARHWQGDIRPILITQCLQNDFFLNRTSPVYLSDLQTLLLLAGRAGDRSSTGDRLKLRSETVKNGPLAVFLNAMTDRPPGLSSTLHVVNVREVNTPEDVRALEQQGQRGYCLAGTWGADYVDGLAEYLRPGQERAYSESNGTRIYHVQTGPFSPFSADMGNRDDSRTLRLPMSSLEILLTILLLGRDDDIAHVRAILRTTDAIDEVRDLAQQIAEDPEARTDATALVGVIGVDSEVRVARLLSGLVARWRVPYLAVSETLTASASLEQHVRGLDMAHSVLGVRVIDGLNDLVTFFGDPLPLLNEREFLPVLGLYEGFSRSKRLLLSYHAEKVLEYQATESRAIDNFNLIRRASSFLIWWGSAFLVVTLIFSIWSAIDPGSVDWRIPVLTGGLSLLQFVTVFYSTPIRELHQNLTNLAAFKMILESHSLKTAFTRYHLFRPHMLDLGTTDDVQRAKSDLDIIERQLAMIDHFDALDFDAMVRLGVERPSLAAEPPPEPPLEEVEAQERLRSRPTET